MADSGTYPCDLCPRSCGIDRNVKTGYCGETNTLRIGRAALHMWEEPCISGEPDEICSNKKRGSGAVFFSGCNMGCVFCQNRKISRGGSGKYVLPERLTDSFFELEDKGAYNINLVTGDIFIPSIAGAVKAAKDRGIKIPFIFNTGSYIKVESLKLLDGLIDIYLPDLKYITQEDAIRYSNAPDYVNAAKAAIDEMVRQQPERVYDGVIMKKGVIIRHLLLPGKIIQAKMIVRYIYERYGEKVYLSLLNQYTPNGNLEDYPEINRKVTGREYDSLVRYAQELGITNAYIQEGETAKESFIPDFDGTGV